MLVTIVFLIDFLYVQLKSFTYFTCERFKNKYYLINVFLFLKEGRTRITHTFVKVML